MEKIIWTTEKRKISELNPAIYNPREMTKKQAEDLENSIDKFSLVDPVIINQNNTIIGGHQRINILKQKYGDAGFEIDVRVPSKLLTLEEEQELNLRLNKNLGQWNLDILANFGEELLKDIGFESQELDKIFQLDTKPDDDDVPEVGITDIKLGDMFWLDEHKLLCGDATKKEDVEKLMQGEKADMVFTDPPYGVDYGAKNRFLHSFGFGRAGKRLEDIKNDMLGKDELFDMLVKAFTLAAEYGQNYCSYYVTAPQDGELGLIMMMMMMMMSGLPVKHILIWVKNRPNFSLGRLDYEYQHEPILFTWKEKHKFYGRGIKKSVWEIDKELKCDLHPTMKPVALIENSLLNSSQRDELVLDLFGGSGSTLIACEKLNRNCRMMEIDPLYCDVIIKRWEKFTGKTVIKIN